MFRKSIGKVAKELTDKGYCSTKSLYYYGVKLHALAFRRLDKIPFPEEIQITPASVNDLTVFKEAWSEKTNRNFFGDKIYNNLDFFTELEQEKKSIMMTPIKGIKGSVKKSKIKTKQQMICFQQQYQELDNP